MEKRSKMDGIESARVRWAFGPDGEYRFEYGPDIVIYDIRHGAIKENGVWSYEVDTRRYQPREGRHNRYQGNMLMSTGMAAGGISFPTAVARLLGSGWTDYWLKDARFEFAGEEIVKGHRCKKILASVPSRGDVNFWVDCDLGVVRKWGGGEGDNYKSVCYETIRLNPPLARNEFEIPDGAIQNPDP